MNRIQLKNNQAFMDDIKEKSYSNISINLSKELLKRTVLAFRKFDKETSIKDKRSTNYRYNEKNRIEVGYRDKSIETGFDSKCYFHYHPDLHTRNFLPGNESYKEFLALISKVYLVARSVATDAIHTFTGMIEKDKVLDSSGNPSMVIRILNYKPKGNCKFLAKKHADRGIISLTLFETSNGLRFGIDKMQAITYREGTTNIFISGRWNEFSNFKLKPLLHEVLNKSHNRERSSIVALVNARD